MKKLLTKYHFFLLVLVIGFAFFTRIIRLHDPGRYIFDEVYHGVTSKLISRNDPRAYEWWNPPVEKDTAVDWLHPPLAKYTQAVGIKFFGENSFGWRISSVVFGTLTILAVYKLAEELFDDKNTSLLAAFLASLDGLLLTQSRIAMNDIHVTFFILLTLIIYLRYRKTKKPGSYIGKVNLLLGTGLLAGVSIGTKWSGLFVLLIVMGFETWALLHTGFKRAKKGLKNLKLRQLFRTIFLLFIALIIIPASTYVASYAHMFIQGKSLFCFQEEQIQGKCYYEELGGFTGYISHFGELHRQIWHYQTTLKATHGYQSRPWQWFTNMRPVWFHVDYTQEGQIGNIFAQGNHILFWSGDAFVFVSLGAIGVSIASLITYQRSKKLNLPEEKIKKKASVRLHIKKFLGKEFELIFLVVSFFAVWLPWQLSPRIMFFYHYTPAVALLSIILSFWLIKLTRWKWGKFLVGGLILLIVLNFVIFYPNWTGLAVPKDFANNIYFAHPKWK